MTNLSSNSGIRNRRPSKLIALLGAALMAGTGAAYAQAPAQGQGPAGATQAGPATPGAQRGDGPRMGQQRGGRHHMQRGGHGGPRGHARMMQMFSPAKVAGALAAIETGIGVQPDQMEAWRTFSAALVAFADGAQPPHMGMRRGGGVRMMPNANAAPGVTGGSDDTALEETIEDQVELPGDDVDDAVDSADTAEDADDGLAAAAAGPGFIMLDRMADRAIAQGERAETLKTALAQLQQTLTPGQIDTARSLVRSMMRDARREHRAERRGGRDGEMRHGKPHHGEHHRRHPDGGLGNGPDRNRD